MSDPREGRVNPPKPVKRFDRELLERLRELEAENQQLRLDAHTKDAFYGGRVEELEAENKQLREALTAIREAAEHKAELHPTLLWIADQVNEVVNNK